jgi:hypothetical protein
MAEYSGTRDVKDPVLAAVTAEADHAEAERALNREMKARGIDPAIVADPELLTDASVAYACMVRSKYEMQADGDAYHLRLKEYRKAWEEALEDLTAAMVTDAVNASGGAGSAVTTLVARRG